MPIGVRESVRKTHALLAQLLHHEHASLALAQRCSGVAAPTPLFSALLNYRYSDSAVTDQQSLGVEGIDFLVSNERSSYPFVLSVDDLGQDFMLTAQVDASLDPQRICGFMQTALEQLVDALETQPPKPVCQIDVLPQSERDQVLVQWNATDTRYPADCCVHELFETQVARNPDAAAVVCGDVQLSYEQLNVQANRLAHYLRARGVTPQTAVAILLERSIDLVIAELAVLKCGAIYVPLDRQAPERRLRLVIEDCQALIVLSTSTQVCPPLATVARINLDELALGNQPTENPATSMAGDGVAYVMYTSGSTGQPKGAIVAHRAISRLVINNGYADFGPSDRVAFAANPAFDASTMEVWGPLLNGGCICIVEQDTLLAPAAFAAFLRREQITVLWLTVGIFNRYADALAAEFLGLRYLIVGGDALDARTVGRVLKHGRPQHFLNGYGPTETTTFAATHEIVAVEDGCTIPIGRPIANTRIYILDRYEQPVPVGVVGELYIGGAGVARGYLNRPELTVQRFLPNPFVAGDRLYKTGDLGRYRPDGTIEFIGRNDSQVKIRGFRVELGEIQVRLLEHEAIAEAVVLTREDAPGDKRLVAYYTPAVGADEVSVEALRAHLAVALPEYMVPRRMCSWRRCPSRSTGSWIARLYRHPMELRTRCVHMRRRLAKRNAPSLGYGATCSRSSGLAVETTSLN